MGEVIGCGITHFPRLARPNSAMAGRLRWALNDPDVPSERKPVDAWPREMAQEWGSDEGAAAAEAHRTRIRSALAHVRAELDSFQPDVVVFWGDDQYELFREDVVPPFCVLAVDEFMWRPWAKGRDNEELGNVWDEPADTEFRFKGAQSVGAELATYLLEHEIDASYSYRLREDRPFPHAFGYSALYLDYDRRGFPFPMLPIQVNCYGRNVIARRAGASTFAELEEIRQLDPPSPSPQRCMQLGAAIGTFFKESPYKVALVASSSWSHAFLHEKAWHLHPDMDSDRAYYEALRNNEWERWRSATLADVEASGQQEMLNWFALVGAVRSLGLAHSWSDFIPTYLFNSNKCFALFR
jgi:hypothetical protein